MPVYEFASEPTQVYEFLPEFAPIYEPAPESAQVYEFTPVFAPVYESTPEPAVVCELIPELTTELALSHKSTHQSSPQFMSLIQCPFRSMSVVLNSPQFMSLT